MEPYTLSESEFLKGQSWFHWCPNTHLHPKTRMHSLYNKTTDSWGKVYNYKIGWYCTKCHLLEEMGWND